MKHVNISFRADSAKIKDLDLVASALDRDRSYLINEAITSYLDLYQWQIQHIKEGVRQANEGEFASEDEVNKVLKKRSH